MLVGVLPTVLILSSILMGRGSLQELQQQLLYVVLAGMNPPAFCVDAGAEVIAVCTDVLDERGIPCKCVAAFSRQLKSKQVITNNCPFNAPLALEGQLNELTHSLNNVRRKLRLSVADQPDMKIWVQNPTWVTVVTMFYKTVLRSCNLVSLKVVLYEGAEDE